MNNQYRKFFRQQKVVEGVVDRLYEFDEKRYEENQLVIALQKTQEELKVAYRNLDFAEDEKLIDSYIYELKALQNRYEYLLKRVKESNLEGTVNMELYKFK